MVTKADIAWFKGAFGAEMAAAVKGTPFEVDHLVAIACQETGYIWSTLRKDQSLTPAQISALCVGDTIDAPNRSAFPKTAADLIAAPRGKAMFDIARAAIVALGRRFREYEYTARSPLEFAHGFGIWQYDIQFFKDDPDYFLDRRYENAAESARNALVELAHALRKLGLAGATKISDADAVKCFIIYNTGRYVASRGLQQGYKNDAGRFYGEAVNDFLALARSVPTPIPVIPAAPASPPKPGHGKTLLSAFLAALGSGGLLSSLGAHPLTTVGVVAVAALAAGGGYLFLKHKGIVK